MSAVDPTIPPRDASSRIARRFYSGFDRAHDTYNAVTAASDGNIYYVLSSESREEGGRMYAYHPGTDQIRPVGDLTEVCGERGLKAVPQGKSHVRFYEKGGKLYLATHVGYYETVDGIERLPTNLPQGYRPYPGGHLLAYDLSQATFEDLAIAPRGEGILTLTMDQERDQLYAITWPRGYFIRYDLVRGRLTNFGPVDRGGEAGEPGKDYRVLCRALLADPRDGKVYFSTSEGDVLVFDPANEGISRLAGVHLQLDYFGKYDPGRPGSMAYHWRQIFWHPTEEVAYGVHGNSGYLFRFDPRQESLELVERITSEPSRRSGFYDQFSYGYLGFDLGPDQETIYYLTGDPIYVDGRRIEGERTIAKGGARGLENLHLVTYHLPTHRYRDHGPIYYPDGTRPTYVNSLAVGPDGMLYTLARYEYNGKVIQDLIQLPVPRD